MSSRRAGSIPPLAMLRFLHVDHGYIADLADELNALAEYASTSANEVGPDRSSRSRWKPSDERTVPFATSFELAALTNAFSPHRSLRRSPSRQTPRRTRRYVARSASGRGRACAYLASPLKVWPGKWKDSSAAMLRLDLSEGALCCRDAAEGIRRLHSLRRSFVFHSPRRARCEVS